MRLRGWLAVPALLIALAAPLRADDPADRRALSGSWAGFIADPRGERPGPVRFSEIRITPERIRGTQGDGRDMGEGTYQLGTAGSVRTLDSTGLAGEPRGKTFLGIYEIRGDTLRWCVANPGKPRPSEFASRPSSGQFLMVLTRKR